MDRHNQLNHNLYVFGVAFQPIEQLPSTNGHTENRNKSDLIFIGMIATTIAQQD